MVSLKRGWRWLGGGSLSFSVLVHVVILVAAAFCYTVVRTKEPAVDFLPGGAKGDKSNEAVHQVQNKRLMREEKIMPAQRLTAKSSSATIALPDLPVDTLDVPDMSAALLGSGKMEALSGGALAMRGEGNGSGAMKGAMFGLNEGSKSDLVGTMYDTKQDRERNSRIKNPEDYMGDYQADIGWVMKHKLGPKSFEPFYEVKRKLFLNRIFIPDMPADAGPAAFKAEDEVKPRMWFVHYSGEIVPPERGTFRFLGDGDDVLIVLLDGKVVLDAGWANRYNKETGFKLPEPRTLPGLAPSSKLAAGNWMRFDSLGRRKIDIIIGEHPGGRVHFVLLTQQQGKKYEEDANGTPILPLFTTSPLTEGDKKELRAQAEKPDSKVGFQIDLDHSPSWGVKQDTPRHLF